jgi:RPA family protein
MAEEYKRHIAFKLRIGNILIGKPIFEGERFSFLELENKKIVRINLVGNIVDKYESEGEKKYIFFTIDDGSGQIKLKSFGEDIKKFEKINQGDTVLVIGVLRHWNNETYLAPEIIKHLDPKYLLVRKLEIEKEKNQNIEIVPKEQIIEVKDKILGAIKNSEENGGIDVDKIIIDLRDISQEIINQEIQKFISEGIIFEPRPGRVRYLG